MSAASYAGLSDVGRKRSRNDDRWGADPAQRLYIVADGVGSTSHGDLVAGLVVEMLPSYVGRYLGATDLRDAEVTERLGRAVVEMCDDLYARSRNDSQIAGSDTTLVAAVISDLRAVIAHLGDSRAYLYRDRQVRRLTSDHTIVQAVIDAGELTAEQAAHHPNRSVVTRHVLMTPPAKPDVSAVDLRPGDRILLSSDGLHGVVDDATLAAILADHPDPADACRVLTDAANTAGGPDNITAVVVHADQAPSAATPVPGAGLGNDADPPPRTLQPTMPDFAVATMAAPTAPQHSGDPTVSMPQQHSPHWPPAPPTPPATPPPQIGTPLPQPQRPRGRRELKWALLAAVIVVLAAAAGITGYLVWPRLSESKTSTTPTANTSATSTPSRSTGQPAPPQAVLPLPGLHHPEGVAVDKDGNIYVVAVGEDKTQVLKLAVGASTPKALPFTGLKGAYGVAVDNDGNVYVTDSYQGGRVLQLPPGSSTPTEMSFGSEGFEPLEQPSGVAVDTEGNVYVVDTGNNRVVKVLAGSGSQATLRFTGLDRPNGVAVDRAGDVYVTDQGKNRVLKLAPGSSDQTVVPFAGLDRPNGVAVNAVGDVYITDLRNHRVVKLPAGSRDQSVLPFTGLHSPAGVAVDSAGVVYVADEENGRVVKLSAG